MPAGGGDLVSAVTRVRDATGLDAVVAARDLRRLTEAAMREAVGRARAGGATWQEIGEVLGASRQAAFQRFGRPVDAPPDPAAPDRAVEILLDLIERRFAEVAARFDTAMAAAVPITRLEEVRDRVEGLVGAYRGMGEPFAHRAGDLTVARVPLRFEAGELSGEVTFDAAGRIAGLFVRRPDAI